MFAGRLPNLCISTEIQSYYDETKKRAHDSHIELKKPSSLATVDPDKDTCLLVLLDFSLTVKAAT